VQIATENGSGAAAGKRGGKSNRGGAREGKKRKEQRREGSRASVLGFGVLKKESLKRKTRNTRDGK